MHVKVDLQYGDCGKGKVAHYLVRKGLTSLGIKKENIFFTESKETI